MEVVLMIAGGDTGHWVRAKNERSAKLFVAELAMFRPKVERIPQSRWGWAFLIVVLVAFVALLILNL
jgi:hypothetical protein